MPKHIKRIFNKSESPSNIDLIISDLFQIIDSNQKDRYYRLFNTLADKFIYPGIVRHDKKLGCDEHYECTLIEALFFDYPLELLKIVNLLIQKDDAEFYNRFKDSIEGTTVTEKMLFDWTPHMNSRLRRCIFNIKRHGEEKEKDHSTKGGILNTLQTELTNDLNTFINKNIPDSPTPKEGGVNMLSTQMKTLQFKLNTAEKLHQHDKILSAHKGWKRVFGNMISILFTAGIPNLFCRLFTGSWLLFNKTTSDEHISNAQEAIGLPEKMRFNQNTALKRKA